MALPDELRSILEQNGSIVTDAMKRYARRKDKNLIALMQMAETFKVTKLRRNYMEILL